MGDIVIVFKIRELRKKQGLTLIDLAQRSGISKSEISEIETGKRDPRFSTIVNLAEALNVSINDVFEK